jgi:hypothetical protein
VESLIKASVHTSDFVNQNLANQNLTMSAKYCIFGLLNLHELII